MERKLLEFVADNCLTWLIREKIREGASLDMLLVGGCLRHRNCKVIKFSFLEKQGEQSADTLDFQWADFGLFRDRFDSHS